MNKVLMVASNWTHIRNFHLPYLHEFQKLGWTTHVGCFGIPESADGIDKCMELPFEKSFFSLTNFRVTKQLRSIINDEKYDLIIVHTSLAAFFTRLAVKGMHDRPRVINVVHGYLFDDDTPFVKKTILSLAEKFTAKETDLILVMNEWDYEYATRHHLGWEIKLIPGMGVDFSKFDLSTKADGVLLRTELGIPENAFVLIYPAEFSKRKSQSVLIKAMSMLPEKVFLVLPGSGVLLEECKALVESLKLENRVLFPGYISDIGSWYRMANAAVTASRIEGLPFNVMEAMYCGLPVIASRTKGHIDLIKDGETGYLYPYGDSTECAEVVKSLVSDRELDFVIRDSVKRSLSQYRIENVSSLIMKKYLGIT